MEGVMKVTGAAKRMVGLGGVFLLLLFGLGCGGGGGGGSVPTGTSAIGLAAKGPIVGGTVEVYAISVDGTIGTTPLATAVTSSDGSYAVDLGSYTGNVLVVVTGGTYRDEATGDMLPNPLTLRAAVTNASGLFSAAVTPMTEIAVRLAGTPLTTEKIARANALVSSLIGINILSTMPDDVTVADTNSTLTEIEYGLMLAVLSQYSQNSGKEIGEVIDEIVADLSDGDTKLNNIGNGLVTALADYLNNENNQSGATEPYQILLDDNLRYYTDNPLNPPAGDLTDLWKAKAVVVDFRDTVLTVWNYTGVGAAGIIQTPIQNLCAELQTQIIPELSGVFDRAVWIILSASEVYGQPGVYTYYRDHLVLTITVSADSSSISFTVVETAPAVKELDGTDTLLDQGTLTLGAMIPGYPLPGSGTLTATMSTASYQQLTVEVQYTGKLSLSDLSFQLTFTGSIESPVIAVDFSQSGRKISVSIVLEPLYPKNISGGVRVTTSTTQLDGSLNVDLVSNTSTDTPPGEEPITQSMVLPKTFALSGSFKELHEGLPTGVEFGGTISGNWVNAQTFNTVAPISESNFPVWNATFNGYVRAPERPEITALLSVSQEEYGKVEFDVSYRRTNPDRTIIFLSGSGEFDYTLSGATSKSTLRKVLTTLSQKIEELPSGILTAQLSNQDGMLVNIYFNCEDYLANPKGYQFGDITTSGGLPMATLFMEEGIPKVRYADGSTEPILPAPPSK